MDTLNRTVPDLGSDQNRRWWRNLEVAKHRLIYSLLKLQLPFAVIPLIRFTSVSSRHSLLVSMIVSLQAAVS